MSDREPPADLDLSASTVERFPDWPGEGDFAVHEIVKGGSGRRFYRLERCGQSICSARLTRQNRCRS